MDRQVIEITRRAFHNRVDELLRAMDGVAVIEWSIESFCEPEVCLSQSEDAVEEMFLSRHPARRQNLVGGGNFGLPFLVIKSLPWSRDSEVLQQSLVIAVEMWLLGPPVKRQVVPFTPSRAGNFR